MRIQSENEAKQVQDPLRVFNEEAFFLETYDAQKLSAVYTVPTIPVKGAVLILGGSGITGPEGDVSSPFVGSPLQAQNAKLNEQLATRLAEEGFASLRFAKRGWDNADELAHHDMPHLIADAKAAFHALTLRSPQVKKAIVGFSEGSVIATSLAAELDQVVALFLLAPLSRSIDDILDYQLITWPLQVLRKIDRDQDGIVTSADFSENHLDSLPLTPVKVEEFLASSGGKLDIDTTGKTFYENYYKSILGFVTSSPLAKWYYSMKEMPTFSDMAKKIFVPVHFFVPSEDSQLDSAWILKDATSLKCETTIKTFHGVGHCFSPFHDGLCVKSSGPYSSELMDEFLKSVQAALG